MVTTTSTSGKSAPNPSLTVNGTGRAVWHKSAPPAVRRAFSSENYTDGWIAWKKHLARRKTPLDPARLIPGAKDALRWGLSGEVGASGYPQWLIQADRSLQANRTADPALEKKVLVWLGESAGAAAGTRDALDALACGRAMARLAGILSPEIWWALLDHLLGAVADAKAIELQANFLQPDPLAHQLLAGELALTLAYLLPEIASCRKLKSSARRVLSAGIVDLLDGQGLPHGEQLGLLRPLLACWTRCRALGERIKGGCFTVPAAEQYEWLLRQSLRLARHDGSQVFSDGSPGEFDGDLLRAALRFSQDDDDRQIAELVLPGGKKSPKKRVHRQALPEAATHSPWAGVTMLRTDWSRSAERLTVVYAGKAMRVELSCGKDVLWSGPWELDLRVDGRPVEPVSDWEEVCWVSDEDVDYLELEIALSGDLRVQRQMLLAHEDRFLFLADAVLADRSVTLEYRTCLPLRKRVSWRQSEESREGLLVAGKRRASVLPLALPEWKADRRTGELLRTDAGLELRQLFEGRGLYAPLFLDLDRRRHTRPLTWRRLTVAESLQVQPDDVAVGYRVAVDEEQWLIYRSLTERANRTLLGHNLSTEMLVARFDRTGEVEPLVEVE
ncbi:MAG TPA: hypothetical protein VMY42_06880 [Thermoguttaceae bacterium]|nr:hypothetical protein [Thermoguttaceae bacterium]